jgi:hypothetical protein
MVTKFKIAVADSTVSILLQHTDTFCNQRNN